MIQTAPHYLLFTEAKEMEGQSVFGGRWRFVLEEIGTENRVEESEIEPGVRGERLQLLAVVRGLEAFEQPSRVTLFTPSKYVGRGIRLSLSQWKQNEWRWESFGEMKQIKHHDLWKRIDTCMSIHQVSCRVWQFDPPHQRTQTAQDQADPSETIPSSNANPVFRFDPAEMGVRPSKMRPNKIRLRPSSERARLAKEVQMAGNAASVLADRVKPVGSGRAFGYARN